MLLACSIWPQKALIQACYSRNFIRVALFTLSPSSGDSINFWPNQNALKKIASLFLDDYILKWSRDDFWDTFLTALGGPESFAAARGALDVFL